MPLRLPVPTKEYNIPALGMVVLKGLTISDVRSVFEKLHTVEEKDKGSFFSSLLIQKIIVEPELDKQGVISLPEEAKSELINLLVEELGIRDEFDSLVEVPSIENRLYRAIIKQDEKYIHMVKESLEETELRSDEIGPSLIAAKFWISPSVPMGLFSHIIDLFEKKEATQCTVR